MQVTYSLKNGGSEKLALSISAHLDRDAFRPSMCALDIGGELSDDLEKNLIPYEILFRNGMEFGVMRRMYKTLIDKKIDIVHTHHFTQLFYTFLAAKLAKVIIVHTEHEYYSYVGHPRESFLLKMMSRYCDKVTVVSPEVYDYFSRIVGIEADRILTVPSGIDIEKFEVPSSGIRGEMEYSDSEVVIGIVGRLEKEKDHRTLFRSLRIAQDRDPQLRLLVIGDGSLRSELEAFAEQLQISDKVRFLGNRTDVPELLPAIDIFILSSVNEGLPVSVIEAMAAGRPVIATDVGSLKFLVRKGRNGILVPPQDELAMSDAMTRLARDGDLRRKMGAAGHEIAVESFSLKKMVEDYQKIYLSVTGSEYVRN